MVFVAPSKFFIFLPGDEDDKPSITAEMPAEFHEAIQNAQGYGRSHRRDCDYGSNAVGIFQSAAAKARHDQSQGT